MQWEGECDILGRLAGMMVEAIERVMKKGGREIGKSTHWL
jgi:hypothetical protein